MPTILPPPPPTPDAGFVPGPGPGPSPTASQHPGAPVAAGPGAFSYQLPARRAVTGWLVKRRNEGATPDQICAQLVAAGWDADEAGRAALLSLRSSDRHRLLYIAQCWGAGLAALGAGTAAHLALEGAGDSLHVAWYLTVTLVATPIAIGTGMWARRVEATEPHAIWSPTRRTLFATLATCTATVGIVRLLSYLFLVMAAMVGAEGYELTPESLVQVMVTLGLATPLFWWSLVEWRRSNVTLRLLRRPVASSDTDGPERQEPGR